MHFTDGYELESAMEMKERLNKLTRMLCNTLTKIDEGGGVLLEDLNIETLQWWSDHKELDRRRLAAKREAEEHTHRLDREEYERLKAKLGL